MRCSSICRWLLAPLAAGSCALLLMGCTKVHAKTMPDLPDVVLDVPPAPPHTVDVTEVEAPPQPPPAPAPEPPRTAPPRPRPATPAREQPKPAEPAKPEPPPPEPPKTPEEPARGANNTLQTTPATAEGELERSVKTILTRANTELGHVDYRGLNADAKMQYDTAKRLIKQADDAVKAKNLVFAKSLADKAVGIADQLGGR